MSSVQKTTNMCGNAHINDARELVWEITLWVIDGCNKVTENPTGKIMMSCQVYQIPPTCVDDLTLARL